MIQNKTEGLMPTKEQIIIEPAGRRLDEWTRLMVFENKQYPLHGYYGLPSFSTNIEHAWLSVNLLCNKYDLTFHFNRWQEEDSWGAGFTKGDIKNKWDILDSLIYGETAELCITKAAIIEVLAQNATQTTPNP